MRAVFLIAVNFLRESRWAIVLLLFWVLISGIAAAYSVSASPEDALFFLKQQTVYGVVFVTFLAGSAIYNQRRSRRILAVLSKAISRRQYLAGLELGLVSAAAIYCAALAGMGAVVFGRAGRIQASLLAIAVALFAASVLAASVALLFSTFLPPLFTFAATGVVVGVTGVLAQMSLAPGSVLPVYPLMQWILEYSYQQHWITPWGLVAWSLLETGLLWSCAALVFARRDLAVAIE